MADFEGELAMSCLLSLIAGQKPFGRDRLPAFRRAVDAADSSLFRQDSLASWYRLEAQKHTRCSVLWSKELNVLLSPPFGRL